MGEKLRGASFAELIAFFLVYKGNSFIEDVKNLSKSFDEGKIPQLSSSDAIDIHFEAKGSYTQQFKFFSAIKRKLPPNTFHFPRPEDVVTYKRELKLPQKKIFTNPCGKTVGRVVDFLELLRFQFSTKDIVRNCNWFLPQAVIINHTDGAKQSLVVELVSCLLRLLNLGDVARNPASLLILALEQSHESTELFDLIFNACDINKALKELEKSGIEVICVGEGCELCEKNIPRERKKGIAGVEEFFHSITFLLLYVWDRKAHNRKLGLRDGYCQNCNAALGKQSYRTTSKGKQNIAMIKDYINADKLYRKHLENYRQKLHRCQPATIHEVDREAFKTSGDFLMYQKEAGEQFNGFCVDQVTPLDCHITGTMHAEIHFAEFLVELGLVLAQRVEELHPGLGVHAFIQSLRFSGVPHESERVKEYAVQNHKGKFKTFATAGTSPIGTVTVQEALATEFKKWIAKGSASTLRLKELLCQLGGEMAPISNKRKGKKEPTKEPQSLVLSLLRSKTNEEIKALLAPEEHELFERQINNRLVTKFLAENSEDKINVREVVGKSTFKINGRDARALAGKGGAFTMYHHLDVILTEQRLKNREALNFHFDQLHELELKSSEAEALVRRLSRKISALQDMSPDAFKQEDGGLSEIEEMDAILEELSTYDKEVDKYRKQIIDLGQDAYKLYLPTQVIEQDDTCKKVMKIATAFRDLYWPVLYPSSEKKEELLADLVGFRDRAKKFLKEIEESDLNIDFKDHSYYLHWLVSEEHAERECRFTLERIGVHISKLNEQTSEHFNKVVKAKLIRLQGFTNRAVGNNREADILNNKMGFVMDENFIQNFYFPHTLLPKRKAPKCGMCDEKGHYQRSCKLPCTKCGSLYFKGHHKSTCALQKLSHSPMKKL